MNETATAAALMENLHRLTFGPRNRVTVRQLINKILAYSAIKINANPPLLYSVLKPDTSSDSPSARSNGVRLVSAKQDANHIPANGGAIKINPTGTWAAINSFILNLPTKIKNDRRISARLTSYEIVWATLRNPPSTAYFELEDQPLSNTVYTPKLVQHRKKRIPRLKLCIPYFIGRTIHTTRARPMAATGAVKYTKKLATNGWVDSLVKSLIASANGWGTPIHPTLLGPLRIWMYPKTFRSNKVKNATPINTNTTKIRLFNRTTTKSLAIITIQDLPHI
jgi:hypothetical protein